MSGDPDQEYFADGMVEEIITGLARIRWLTVIARNSTFAYKGKSPDMRQVGRELAVRYVVEGSVRKAGNKVRITAQLIEAETGGHLWADRFDGTLDDVFDLQDRITAGVVAAIEPSVRQAEIERAKRKRPDNLDAYDLYLRALEQSYTYTPAGRDAGLSLLEAAIALDPGYVQAHGVAAFCLQQRFLWGGRAPADRKAALAHAEAVAAARTDDATALAFAALALSALAGRHDAALVMVDRAIEQNPSSATAHTVYALINMMLGRPDKSVFHAERSLRLSPFDPLRHIPECTLSVANLAAGQDEAALVCVRKGLEANPVFTPGLTTLAICLVRLGRIEEARATVHRLVEIAPDTRVATLQERYLFSNSLGFERIVADLRAAGLPE
jgi:TolB-like protein/Tfp pilus assembly protein PilF